MANTKKSLACPTLRKMHQKYKAIQKNMKMLPIKKRTLCSFYTEPLPKPAPRPRLPKPEPSTSAAPSTGTSATTAAGTQTQSRYQVAAVERPMTRRESRRVHTESVTSSPSSSVISSAVSSPAPSPTPSAASSKSLPVIATSNFPRMHQMLTTISNDASPLDLSIRAAAPPAIQNYTAPVLPTDLDIYTNCLLLLQLEDF